MKKNFVITIGRQFGSGGRDIGLRLSKLMQTGYYDRGLITEAARRSGLSSRMLEREDEKTPGTFWHALSFGIGFNNVFSQESFFKIQSDTIKEIASRESCVIVGRCADYVLRENPRCFNIFLHAPLDTRAERVSGRMDIPLKQAVETINKIDKDRAAYYDFYTDKRWGYSSSYHLSVDSSLRGIEGTTLLIRDFVESLL